MKISEPNHLLSQMYKLMLSEQETTTPYFIKEWENELNCTFTPSQRKKLIEVTHSSSVSSSIQEMSYKFLTRWYRTPVQLAQIYPNADIRCWRGCKDRGTYLHIWWTCPKIKVFWEEIAPWIKRMSNKCIELTPIHFLFHGTIGSTRSYKNSLTPHLLNAAKRLIPRYWKQATCPTLGEWKREVEEMMEAERWVYKTRNKQDRFEKIWAKWEN